jgi:hypothetical protein
MWISDGVMLLEHLYHVDSFHYREVPKQEEELPNVERIARLG